MKTNINISKQKVWKAITALLALSLITGMVVYAGYTRSISKTKGISVSSSNKENQVISKQRILNLLEANGLGNVTLLPLKDLDLKKIEQVIKKDPWVKSATVFINNNENIQIDIKESTPVARIFFSGGKSAYVSENGSLLPADARAAFYIPVFTNVPYLGNDEMSKKILGRIAYIGNVLSLDTFWNAQFTQLQLNENLNILASTVMGDQIIKLGDTVDLKQKLNNLLLFYKNGLSKIGFKQYQVVDASFKNQIIASPGIGYVAPVMTDTSVSLPDEDLLSINRQNKIVTIQTKDTLKPKAIPTVVKPEQKIKTQPTATAPPKKIKAEDKNKKVEKPIVITKKTETTKNKEVKPIKKEAENKKKTAK